MKLVSTETSLVIAGAWNPAILAPAWVLQHGLNKSLDGGNLVQAFLPATQGVIFEFPRYVLENLSFIVRPDTLILFPPDPLPENINALGNLEDAAANILRELKHTPVTGIGHNFTFIHSNPDPKELNIFTASTLDLIDRIPTGWSPASYVLAANFKNETDTVIINIQRQFEANNLIVKFNFHHPIKSIEEALTVLNGENDCARMVKNLELAKQLMKDLYGEFEND